MEWDGLSIEERVIRYHAACGRRAVSQVHDGGMAREASHANNPDTPIGHEAKETGS